MEAVKITAMTDEIATIEGHLVIFGGRDLDGETFTKDTDFWSEQVAERPPVLYEHGFDETIGRSVLGHVTSKTVDDAGLWVTAEIQRSKKYAEQVLQLVEAGRLGWSSGSVPHLVEKVRGLIKSWPIIEASLTPMPAEPRTLGLRFGAKSAAISLPPELEGKGWKSGEPLSAHGARVLDELTTYVDRLEERAGIRVKEGRRLSTQTRDLIASVLEAIDTLGPARERLAALFAETDRRSSDDESESGEQAKQIRQFEIDMLARELRDLGVQV